MGRPQPTKAEKGMFYGTASWIDPYGQIIPVEGDAHLESLVDKYFMLDEFKRLFNIYVDRHYSSEADADPTTSVASPEEIEEFETVQELTPLRVGEIFAIVKNLENMGSHDAADALMELIQIVSEHGFDQVIFGNMDAYDFAFRLGYIRVRSFYSPTAFIAELNASKLNRTTAGNIIDYLLRKYGSMENMPPVIRLDLNAGGEKKQHIFETDVNGPAFEKFYTKVNRLYSAASNKIDKLLKFANELYKKALNNDTQK